MVRFAIYMGYQAILTYLLYILQDHIGLTQARADAAIARNHAGRASSTAARDGDDRNIIISDKRIENVSQDHKEQAVILVTYAAGAIVTHNDISDAPYDGIDVGWGWGINDPGGSGAYRFRAPGYYDQPGNHVCDTPTILRDTVISGNRAHRPTVDNLAIENWYNGGRLNGSWDDYVNNRLVDNIEVKGDAWPTGAQTVIEQAGMKPGKQP